MFSFFVRKHIIEAVVKRRLKPRTPRPPSARVHRTNKKSTDSLNGKRVREIDRQTDRLTEITHKHTHTRARDDTRFYSKLFIKIINYDTDLKQHTKILTFKSACKVYNEISTSQWNTTAKIPSSK